MQYHIPQKNPHSFIALKYSNVKSLKCSAIELIHYQAVVSVELLKEKASVKLSHCEKGTKYKLKNSPSLNEKKRSRNLKYLQPKAKQDISYAFSKCNTFYITIQKPTF